jgi:hypothetical protein
MTTSDSPAQLGGSLAQLDDQDAHVHADTVRELTALFAKSIRRLGQAGQVEEANRLGGQAFVLLMRRSPESAERVNGAMHYLARLPQEPPPTVLPQEPPTTEEVAPCH